MGLRYFPWRLFWRTFLSQAFVFILVLCATLWVGRAFFVPPEATFTLQDLDLFLLKILAAGILFVSLGAIWCSYRSAGPLGRVILKARGLASKKFARLFTNDEDSYYEEPGELFELENALNRIRQKLKKKRESLAKEREETEALVSAVVDAIVSVNLEEKVVFFNSQFANHFMNREQTHVQPRLAEILRVPEVLANFEAALKKGRASTINVKIHSQLDSMPKYYTVSVAPLRQAKTRNVYGAMGIFHDITDLKRVEQIRIDFVGNASHELRTPLTSIKGYLETVNEDFKAKRLDSVEKFLVVINRNVDRLIELVNDLLTISTLESTGGIKPDMVAVEAISRQALLHVEPLRQQKNHDIQLLDHVGEFYADPTRVEQVLVNLISNAIKYIQADGKIRIEWEHNDAGEVILRVIDNGPGIPYEHLGRLFERFYRIDKGRTRDAGGTGLGLSIVKHIMQSHGGTVMVRSEVGVGTEFTCIFPVRQSRLE